MRGSPHHPHLLGFAQVALQRVFGVGEDPVRLGLVASLARPGGNATGINFFTSEVVAKRLRLLHDSIGIVAVAALAANVPALPGVAITATCRRTRSAINAGRRSYWPSSQWYSTVTFWLSM